MSRNLMSLEDLSKSEIQNILNLAKHVKEDRTYCNDLLKGKTIGLVFQKPSNRTRVSFDVGISQLGGNSIYLGPKEINLGVRESTADVSKTLSRYLDGIVARVNQHEDIIDLIKNSNIPIINGLSDFSHPCQGLTDIFSIIEKFPNKNDVTVAYIGDGNNVCHDLMLACVKVGFQINVATPVGYEPDKDIVTTAQSIGNVLITTDPIEAVKNADVIYTDVWVSMGQEDETEKRIKDFKDFQINKELVSHASSDYIFMHCLPAHRDLEVTSDVIDGENSIVFDQAENRLHTQKAIIIYLFEEKS